MNKWQMRGLALLLFAILFAIFNLSDPTPSKISELMGIIIGISGGAMLFFG